ncbi:uncharacterized protein DNG_03839 [Cephalotrichum gorgonifer]|uniref:Methyltransferase type 12 domain-containing protein n=1 Tax=Cephalotrichum gorgonifer TaxID=2041049 RepID=A0AAE8MXQ8_9PEZI|nr:uncharacterized protein DNG_03839 [Cephalotrichum gorgonifer]
MTSSEGNTWSKGLLHPLSYYKCYDEGVLSFYDVWVIGVSFTWAWNIPASTITLPFHRAHLSKNHLDIGVGTGYFPATVLSERAAAAGHIDAQGDRLDQKVTLWDLSTKALAEAKSRIELAEPHATVEVIEADATSLPADFDTSRKFDSISAAMLLHCIPMPTEQKAKGVISTARRLLSPRGVFYGCTVLGSAARKTTAPSPTIDWLPGSEVPFGVVGEKKSANKRHNPFGWALMCIYNRTGVFSNWKDEPDVIVKELEDGFDQVDSWIIGRVLFFKASAPRLVV